MRNRVLLLVGIVASSLASTAGWGQSTAGGGNGVTAVTDGMPVLSLPVGHREEVSAVVYSSTGRLLLSGSFDGTARLWDVASALRSVPSSMGRQFGASPSRRTTGTW